MWASNPAQWHGYCGSAVHKVVVGTVDDVAVAVTVHTSLSALRYAVLRIDPF